VLQLPSFFFVHHMYVLACPVFLTPQFHKIGQVVQPSRIRCEKPVDIDRVEQERNFCVGIWIFVHVDHWCASCWRHEKRRRRTRQQESRNGQIVMRIRQGGRGPRRVVVLRGPTILRKGRRNWYHKRIGLLVVVWSSRNSSSRSSRARATR
jgi:hypothetical protein